MARRKSRNRAPVPGAFGYEKRNEDESYSFKGRDKSGPLHKRGEGRGRQSKPEPQAPRPKPWRAPKPAAIDTAAAIEFTAAEARRSILNPMPTQRERAIAMGLIRPEEAQ